MADTDDKDQKTEEATPRRRSEAREKGQVAMSSELIAAVGLCVGASLLMSRGGHLMDAIGGNARAVFASMAEIGTSEMTVPAAAAIIEDSLTSVLGILGMVTLPAILLSLLVGYFQVGFQITPKALELDLSKLDPIKGAKKLVSMRSLVRTIMSAIKIILITTAVVIVAWSHVSELTRVTSSEIGPILAAIGTILSRSIVAGLSVFVVLAFIDFIFQRYQHDKDLRMTKQEVKEDARLSDGDPHVKAKIRRLQQEIATRQMLDNVPDATVVVTNPTHYAVALRYGRDSDGSAHSAPIVVAKGVDHVAQRIKAIAAEHEIICYEDVSLARALFAESEVGQEIPEDLYAAVATVLGYVYRLQDEKARAASGGVGV